MRQGQFDNPPSNKLSLEYRDGKLFTTEGVRFIPDFPIGMEQHHIDLFVEYERTFGRGGANYYTHVDMNMAQVLKLEKNYGQGFRSAYRTLAKKTAPIVLNGNKEQTDQLIEELRDYRKKYPKLYEDVG